MWYNDTIRPRDACLITAATQVHCFHFELLMCIYNTTTWISISFGFHWMWFMLSASEKASKVACFECHLSQSNHNNSNSRTTFDFKLNNIFVCLFMYRSINFLSLVRSHQYFIQTLHQTNTIKHTNTFSYTNVCWRIQRPKIVSLIQAKNLIYLNKEFENGERQSFRMKFFTCIKY